MKYIISVWSLAAVVRGAPADTHLLASMNVQRNQIINLNSLINNNVRSTFAEFGVRCSDYGLEAPPDYYSWPLRRRLEYIDLLQEGVGDTIDRLGDGLDGDGPPVGTDELEVRMQEAYSADCGAVMLKEELCNGARDRQTSAESSEHMTAEPQWCVEFEEDQRDLEEDYRELLASILGAGVLAICCICCVACTCIGVCICLLRRACQRKDNQFA